MKHDEQYPFKSVSHTGYVSSTAPRRGNMGIPKHSGVYIWSEAALRKVRTAETAIKGLSRYRNCRLYFITLTFPASFDNAFRFSINDRFRGVVRKRFPSGMWVAEAHASGAIHFHYMLLGRENDSRPKILSWLLKQQEKDLMLMSNNGYDLKEWVEENSTENSLYASLYTGKEYQKTAVSHFGRIWAVWGCDCKPLEVDPHQLSLFSPRVVNEHGSIRCTSGDISSFIHSKKLGL